MEGEGGRGDGGCVLMKHLLGYETHSDEHVLMTNRG